jgi:hypothetical protein
VTLQTYRRSRPPRRRRLVVVLAVLAALAVGFLVGFSVAGALDDGPDPGQTETSIRTLTPLPLPPATTTVP